MSDEQPGGGPRQRLLAATMAYVAEHGVGELSLRQLAAAIGTSHRMIVYHFGSKEGLLVAVVRAVEEEQRQALAAMVDDPGDPAAGMAFWRRLSDPALWPNIRLFFELYGQALQGRPHTAALLAGIVDDWVGPLAALGEGRGLDPATAKADARLQVAVARGLLLDLVATGDRAAVDAAMDRYASLVSAAG